MKIYTKFGDKGQTRLFRGQVVEKDDIRVKTYGAVDELNSVLGIAVAHLASELVSELESELGAVHQDGESWIADTTRKIQRIQAELFQLGAELATPRGEMTTTALIGNAAIGELEAEIDTMEAVLKPLRNFILPGGSPLVAQFHFGRTVCRRVEREMITLNRGSSLRAEVLCYINRLSDYLFVVARFCQHHAGQDDILWHPPEIRNS